MLPVKIKWNEVTFCCFIKCLIIFVNKWFPLCFIQVIVLCSFLFKAMLMDYRFLVLITVKGKGKGKGKGKVVPLLN